MPGRWWQTYLAGSIPALVLYLTLPSGIPQDLVYVLIGGSSVVAIMVGVRLHRPSTRVPWTLMALGLLAWVAADVLWIWYEDVLGIDPFPSFADVLYLAGYPLLLAGLAVLILARRRAGSDAAGRIDSSIVSIAFGLFVWASLAGPILDEAAGPLSHRLIAFAYPVLDILLLGFMVRLLSTPGLRTAAFRFLIGAVLLLVAADTMFAAPYFQDHYTVVMDVLWLASYVLWGAAALHPSMSRVCEPTDEESRAFSRTRTFGLTLAVLVAPLTLAVQLLLGVTPNVWAVVVCSMVLFLLVVARMTIAIREVVATASQRDRLQRVLSHEVAHDSLTGLANRASVLEQVESALHRGQRAGTLSALLFVDLDRFKVINDKLGHRAGDAVLCEAARRIRESVREGDTVGRLGGDEFVVLLEVLGSEAEALDLADHIVRALAAPFIVGGTSMTPGASIGIAYSMDARTNARQLLHEADVASARAKAAGGGRTHVFGKALRLELDQQAALEAALGTALTQGEFALHYQPVVATETDVIEGYEALIRWHRPGFGPQPPDTFIPVAEKSDLICEIGRWVLREATGQLSRWTAREPERYGDISVAVNISGRHLAEAGIVADVENALARSGLPAERLVLEITESVLVDVPTAATHLLALKELGVSISIDDFGTGYTSIGQLQRMPADTLKIDKQFVTFTTPADRDLVTLMVRAAHSCGMQVVAEGVETQDQLEELRALAADSVQGYLFARPLPAEAVEGPPGVSREVPRAADVV